MFNTGKMILRLGEASFGTIPNRGTPTLTIYPF
jgi:hypothetical protein